MSVAKEIRESLLVFADPEKASVLRGFFKTAKGAYSEGDKFGRDSCPENEVCCKAICTYCTGGCPSVVVGRHS